MSKVQKRGVHVHPIRVRGNPYHLNHAVCGGWLCLAQQSRRSGSVDVTSDRPSKEVIMAIDAVKQHCGFASRCSRRHRNADNWHRGDCPGVAMPDLAIRLEVDAYPAVIASPQVRSTVRPV